MSAVLEQPTEVVEAPARPMPALGMHYGQPNDDYHSSPGISKTGLSTIISQSPAHYHWAKTHPEDRKDTLAMDKGSAFHCLVLEPHLFDEQFIEIPEDAPPRPTKPQINAKKPTDLALFRIGWWDDFDAKHEGKVQFQAEQFANVRHMADAVHAHPVASLLVMPEDGPVECSCYYIDPTVKRMAKCRPDKWNQTHNALVDLKSARDASFTGFGKAVAEHHYHMSDAMTRLGMHCAGHTVDEYIFLVVENEPPYGVGIYHLDPITKDFGVREYERSMHIYNKCMESGDWPAYPPGIRELDMPGWGLRSRIL